MGEKRLDTRAFSCCGRNVDLEAVLLDGRAGPETLLRARSIEKGKLRKEEGQNNKYFSKRDRSKQTPGHVSEPFSTGTLIVFAYSEVAEQERLRCFHGGYFLLRDTQLEQPEEFFIRLVKV